VVKVLSDKGIVVKYPDGSNTGFIHWFEIAYGSVGRLENLYKTGDLINVVVSEFDAEKNSLKFSIKKQFKHDFQKWASSINFDEPLNGKIIGYFDNSAQIELNQNGYTVQAFILRKFVSTLAFVEKDDLTHYLPTGDTFTFFIEEINEDRESISLNRTEYLQQMEKLSYGEKIKVTYVKENHVKGYFYSNDFEGWTELPSKNIWFGSKIEVIAVSHATGEFQIV